MLNFNDILKDFETISKDIKVNTERVNEQNFIARLVICYTDEQKQKNIETYNKIKEFTQKIDDLKIEYTTRDNKYLYLLHKDEFETDEQFTQARKLFEKKNKICTINITNYDKYIALLNKALTILQANRQVEATK